MLRSNICEIKKREAMRGLPDNCKALFLLDFCGVLNSQ